jgi:uncharacterized protein with HEPN domain
MPRDPRAYLWDVREAALAIQSFTSGMDAETYSRNAMAQAAVERKFEIIGEALSQLSKVDGRLAAQFPDLPQVVAFRNQLIHGYAAVNTLTVWNITRHSVPKLLATVQALMDKLG